jgi:copper(I)-binding protein
MRISTSDRPAANGAAGHPSSGEGRWRGRVVLLALLLCATLAGCYAGNSAETLQETPATTPGVDGAVGSMALNDVYLETANTVPAGGSVALRAAFTDSAPESDRLIAVTTPGAASVELLQPDGAVAPEGIDVPGEGQVDATTGPVLVRLTGLTSALSPEAVVPITFEFANAGSVTLDDVPAATAAQGTTEGDG